MRIKILSTVILLSILVSTAFSKQESFPFLVEVNKDNVNLRAGQNTNFERLCQLKQGDQLVVVDKAYSWYKVRLPQTAKSYVSVQYVKLIDANSGEVTAKEVNVRAGPAVERTVIGKLKLGEKLRIIKQEGEWYKIEPLWDSFGWITEEFVSFKSKDISLYRSQASPSLKEEKVQTDQPKELNKVEKLVGTINVLDSGLPQKQFSITLDDQSTYTLKGFEKVLPEFIHCRVTLEAVRESVNSPDGTGPWGPIFKISKIKLIL